MFPSIRFLSLTPVIALALSALGSQQPSQRPMSFLDVQQMRAAGALAVSPDREWVLYTLSVPNWKEAKRATDIWLVSTELGFQSPRQLTFTKDKNENNPRWSHDGRFFVFSSNRDAIGTATTAQLYLMRPDGGEAVKLTDVKDGVGAFALSKDGMWLAYSAGKADEQQIWALPVVGIDSAKPVQLTRHASPIASWQWSKDAKSILFLASDSLDKDDKARLEKKFDVRVRNQEQPSSHLWMLDVASLKERRLTSDTSYSVEAVTLSDDGRWAGYRGLKNDRYVRNTTESALGGDLYLLEIASGKIERLTSNDVAESSLSFSPASDRVAFSAADDFTYFRNSKLYLRPVAATGAKWRKLGASYDGDVTAGFWSDDGKTIYFTDGVRATNQLLSVDIDKDAVTQLTKDQASTLVQRDDETGAILISYSDPKSPPAHFTVKSVGDVANRASWRQLTNANPQVSGFALGAVEEIIWKSTDGKTVGGILVRPVGYEQGKRYPLIVAIHGGPAAADILGFNGGYGSQIYAGAGYAVLLPNYRGSSNYGERHRTEIVGNYFQKGYEDIMTGVDHLIRTGVVDGNQMGVLGWSAGGHWSNWILTHTDRFKAISSGAGTSNWISMFAQSDVQRNRQHYLGGKLPYDDFEAYWRQSPIRYIRNAKTPTMIHVVDGDPRVPRPQSEELHMALKKIGVPTELFVYPGASHGIPDPRNQLVKSVAEMAWMEKWIRGKGGFQWKDVLKTLEEADAKVAATSP